MDHALIERDALLERYVQGHLPAPVEEELEEHVVDCSACQDDLVAIRGLAVGVRRVASEDAARLAVQVGLLARLRRALPRPGTPRPGGLGGRPRRTGRAGRPARRLRRLVEPAEPRAAGDARRPGRPVGSRPGDRGGRYPGRRRRDRASRRPRADPAGRGRLGGPAHRGTRCRDRRATRPLRRSTRAPSTAPSPWPSTSSTTRASPATGCESSTPTAGCSGSAPAWFPNAFEALMATFPADFFPPGSYRVHVLGLTPDGDAVPLETYPFDVA